MAGSDPEARDARLGVVVCDDAVLNRECLAVALRFQGIDVDGVSDLPSLFDRLEQGIPDVILLNIGTPDGATLLQVALDAGPDVRVIVTGLSEDRESDIVSCAEAGVAGLHLRTESLGQLLTLIHNAADAEALCSQTISAILVRRVYSLLGSRTMTAENRDPGLTDREIQILRLLEDGLSNQQIASRLGVTLSTVKNHVHSLFGKIGVVSRADAVAANRAMRYSVADSPQSRK